MIRVDGQTGSELGPDGNPAPPSPGDQDGETVNPLAGGAPDLSLFPSVIDAVAGGSTGFLRISAIANQLTSANARVAQVSSGVAVRMSDDDHLMLTMPASRVGAGDGAAEVSFERVRGASTWVLRRLDSTAPITSGGKQATMRSRIDLRGMRVRHNVNADRLRDMKRTKRFDVWRDATLNTPVGTPQARQAIAAEENWSRTGIISWNPPGPLPFPSLPPNLAGPGVNYGADKTAEEASNCAPVAFSASQYVPATPGGRKVAFQHGINSDACTWQYLTPFFDSYGSGGRVVGQTESFSTYESQAATLRAQIPAGSEDWVLVGHSNGGIVSRYLAQTEHAGFARAVIAINSPHDGAPIFSGKVGTFLSRVQWMTGAANVIFNRKSAGASSMGIVVSPSSFLRNLVTGDGALIGEMSKPSLFQVELSHRPEAFFRRFAIRSQVPNDWVSVRVYCDRKVSSAPGVPQGRRCVEDAKHEVRRRGFFAGLYGLLSVVAIFIPGAPLAVATLVYHSLTNATVMALRYAVEWAYKDVFTENQTSDGVVPMSSQLWSGSGANQERVITNADSHVGSTRSNLVTRELSILMDQAYR